MMCKKTLTLLLVLLMMLAAGCSGGESAPDESAPEEAASYDELIFDTSVVHRIDVTLSEEDRAEQVANPTEKTKYKADVVIDGEEVKDVAFHTKGNSSLFFAADAGLDKFSYALNFGKFTDGGTFHGLDKLNLQNNLTDATSMREYMAFWTFRRMGVDAPMASYVWLTVNGEDQGLYTALEDVGDSYLERIADGEGAIYKPEDKGMPLDSEEMERLKAGNSAAHNSGGGADLKHKDDNEESYPDIFENAVTDDDSDNRANVISALKALSVRKDLDKYLDTEEIIRYFAVHNYLVNYDSYAGPMLHNYCLHENGGKLAMLPWDYDGCFGQFPADAIVGRDADSKDVINAGIDSPLGAAREEDRPMWSWIVSDETYLKEYHDDLKELMDVIDSGEYEKEAGRVYDLILPYIEKDTKSVFRPERFQKANETLIRISELRAESIRRQLNGQLATRSENQNEEDKVDASEVTIRALGATADLKAGN